MPAPRSSRLTRFLLVAALACSTGAIADQSFSTAETLLFLSDHLGKLPSQTVLHYGYEKAGTLESARHDDIRMEVSAATQGTGRQVHVEYLSGSTKLALPDLAAATGNPVILYFLERDLQEMQRLTGGQAAYFRKRVRMALAGAADVVPVTFEYGGQRLSGQQITVQPYRRDPLRSRYERLADKSYVFTLCEQVPGSVYRLQSLVPAPADRDDARPLIEETITFLGADP